MDGKNFCEKSSNKWRASQLLPYCAQAFEHLESSIFRFTSVLIASYFFGSSQSLGIYISIFATLIMNVPGAFFFSYLGDKKGRKQALQVCYPLLIIPSFLILFIPSYEKIGFISSGFLILLKTIQGFASGGSFTGRVVLFSENKKSDLFLGVLISLGYFATVLGTISGAMSMAFFDKETGWKIPYALAAILGLWVIYYQSTIRESQSWEQRSTAEHNPFKKAWENHKKDMMGIFFLAAAIPLPYYVSIIFGNDFLHNTLKVPVIDLMYHTSFCLLAGGGFTIAVFWLVRYFKPSHLFIAGLAGFGILIPGFYFSFKTANESWIKIIQIFSMMHTSLFIPGLYINGQNFFPAKFRFSAFSIPYVIGKEAIGGGCLLFSKILADSTQKPESLVIICILAFVFCLKSFYVFYKKKI